MLLQALYFFIPSYIANMTPVFVQKIRFLDIPIDLGKSIGKKRILGDNKTWKGLVFGTMSGFIVFEIQKIIFNLEVWNNLALVDYSLAPHILGLILGFTALFGDTVESFIKRRLQIPPGRPWIPFDQLDFLIFSILLTLPFSGLTIGYAMLLLLVVFIATLVVQFSGYKLGFKKNVL